MVEDGLLHVYHAWFCGRIGFLTLLPGSVRSLVPRHYWRWAFWAVLSKTCREPTMVKKGQIMSLNVERSWNQINSEYGKQDPNYLTVHTLLYTIVIYYILYIGYIHVNYLLTDLSGSLVCVCSVCVCLCVCLCVCSVSLYSFFSKTLCSIQQPQIEVTDFRFCRVASKRQAKRQAKRRLRAEMVAEVLGN